MKLHELKPAAGARRPRKRVGRGPGSGMGKTAARGEKGQRSRSGYSRRPGFEGGQMPLHRRLPKRGFTPPFPVTDRIVNIERLAELTPGSVVTPEWLEQAGLIRRGDGEVKVLGRGDLAVALSVRAHRFSASAAQRIRAAGGTVELLPSRRAERSAPDKRRKRKRASSPRGPGADES